MIRTKLARKVLKKKEQQHLTKAGINCMASLETQIAWMRKENPQDPWRICPDCFGIAKKLNINNTSMEGRTMTKAQVRKRFKELQKENRKRENDLLEKALKSGSFDLTSYQDNFQLPRIIMHVVCHCMGDNWAPNTKEGSGEVENLKHFL